MALTRWKSPGADGRTGVAGGASRRPLAITVVGWLFIAVGAVGLTYHLLPQQLAGFKARHGTDAELVWVCAVRAVASLCGVFLLRGCNWARWLLAAWMAYHVALSLFHSAMEVVVHALLFGVVGYFLFRPQASAYFSRQTVGPEPRPEGADPPVT